MCLTRPEKVYRFTSRAIVLIFIFSAVIFTAPLQAQASPGTVPTASPTSSLAMIWSWVVDVLGLGTPLDDPATGPTQNTGEGSGSSSSGGGTCTQEGDAGGCMDPLG